ncbi:MAG: response regulator [Phaeodactylibacter sp.]|nr:response regulator [Phaeodactylibacter sp.]MCB9274172.1 response regulator [Lewinellaceae bacterium]
MTKSGICIILTGIMLLISIQWPAHCQSYRFEALPVASGLPNSTTNKLLQDRYGFLWVATWSGLVQYDGYNVRRYRHLPGQPKSLQSNKITCLFEDSKGRLWIGARNSGFYRFDREQDNFISYRKQAEDMNSLSNDNVWAIAEGPDGKLWIGTEKGLNRFDPETSQFIHYENLPTDQRSLSSSFIYDISMSSDGSLWIGTEDGLNRLAPGKNGSQPYFIRYNLSPESEKGIVKNPHNFIYRIKPSGLDPQVIWVGTKSGLKKVAFYDDLYCGIDIGYYLHAPEEPQSLSHNFVTDIMEQPVDEGGYQVWVATFQGLNLMDPKTGKFRRFFASDEEKEHALANNNIRALFQDQTGILWIGTDRGINKLNLKAKPFETLPLAHSANTNSKIITSLVNGGQPNTIWAGARGGGLNKLSLDGCPPQHYSLITPFGSDLNGFISCLSLSRGGRLWIATQGAGLISVAESSIPEKGCAIKQCRQYREGPGANDISDDYVMSVYETRDGAIWAGCWNGGLNRIGPNGELVETFKQTSDYSINLADNPNVHLLETIEHGEAFLWAGTRGGGLLKLKYDAVLHNLLLVRQYRFEASNAGSLSNDFINCIFLDSRERLWVGTENGLNYLERENHQARHLFEKDGLANDIIQSLLEDEDGNIWASTQAGLSRIRFEGDEAEVKNYDTYDGLADQYFYDGAACRNASGALIFGGLSGAHLFYPPQIKEDELPPKIALVDFRLFNQPIRPGQEYKGRAILPQSISSTDKICLTYRENVFSIEFAALHFAQPMKNKYAYRLKGFDKDWAYVDASHRIAHYTNLPYDDYEFQVKASNNDGIWTPEPYTLKLSISPPIWRTGWAYAFYCCLALIAFYGFWQLTLMRANFRHSLKLERLEREKLEEVNQAKFQFFTNISHELRTPLTLIISPLEELIKDYSGNKGLHRAYMRMHQNANKLLTMINQLLDIQKIEAGQLKLCAAEGNILKFLTEVVLSFQGLAHQRGIHLAFEHDEEQILVWYDRAQMEKVMYNLLSNAFKFTPEGGRISVRAQLTEDGRSMEVSVRDTGVGISAEELPRIFDRFYQGKESLGDSRHSGTGIGLALCQNIVSRHKGLITAQSQKGLGSSFTIQLPLGENHLPEDEKFHDFKKTEDPDHYRLSLVEPLMEPARAEGPQPGVKNRPLLLIVEDNDDIRAYLREYLQPGYRIIEAGNGEEALQLALEHAPSLIVSDVAMPKMDGITLCRQIKTSMATSHIPVILLTARTSLIFRINGLETGADDYITKPFNIQLLSTRIHNLITTRKKLQEKYSRGEANLSPSEITVNSLDEEFLQKAISLVEKHIDDSEFSVEDMARALFMSRMQVYRKLKAITGQSPNHFIRTIRLKRAAQLLLANRYTVSEITYQVGFQDLKYFRERFKKEFGISPSEYAAQHNGL